MPSPPGASFDVGSLQVQYYGVCVLLGFLLWVFVTARLWRRGGGDAIEAAWACLLAAPVAFIGARLYHVITDYGLYSDDPSGIFDVVQGGLGIFGAIAGGVLALVVYANARRWPIATFLDCAIVGVPLAQALGRVGYLASFFDPVQQLSQVYNTFLAGTAALDKIFDVMDDAPTLVDAPDAQPLAAIAGAVHFDHVRFGYNPERPVIDNLNLTVLAGQTVALVGHTGAGKSTIVKLLARFYDPQGGRILIDGHDLRTVTVESLRDQIAIVPQEGFLFNGTIHDNIAFGRPDTSRAEVEAAAREVGADRFIEQLPDGYDERVQERGSRLSIGQRQLIAFARALLVDPRLLILDEATSSVDIQTEAHIEEALQRLLADRTAFVVAHRLSTIRNADLIVVLEHGKIVECGSHDELLATDGRYRGLYGDWAEAVAR